MTPTQERFDGVALLSVGGILAARRFHAFDGVWRN
jgi:hypothetical protein